MTQFSKATNNSGLTWFRVNLTKRKELSAFRNIIKSKVEDINNKELSEEKNVNNESNDYIDRLKRQYLFPSSKSDVNGYYEMIMSSIKFSCWVKCTETELLEMLDDLNSNQITADASRKSNSGTIRVVDENEVNTLKWIIETAPANLYRANVIPKETTPARLPVREGIIIEGELSKMRGKVETDKFFFSVLDTNLFMVINKGTAEVAVDLSQEIENAKKANATDKVNKERCWMVLRASHGFEQTFEENLNNWKDCVKEDPESQIHLETFLPMYMKEIKRNGKIIGQRKSLLCPGYLFIHTSIMELLQIEAHKSWNGTMISRFLVRQSMRKEGLASKALIISDREMTDFKFAVNSNLTNIELDAEDYVDNELVKFYKPGDPFNQKMGRILHKGDKIYLTFLPIGGMKVANVIPIESSQIRKLTNKEKAELKIKE